MNCAIGHQENGKQGATEGVEGITEGGVDVEADGEGDVKKVMLKDFINLINVRIVTQSMMASLANSQTENPLPTSSLLMCTTNRHTPLNV